MESLIRPGLVAGAVTLALHAGCGGVAVDSGVSEDPGIGGSRSARGTFGGGSPVGGSAGSGRGGRVSGPVRGCGNGVLDPGEQCDGQDLGGGTCRTATLNASPSGSLTCAGCKFDTSGCRSAGAGGRSGGGTGGSGTGGWLGNPCYEQGGVPEPGAPDACAFGQAAIDACIRHFTSPPPATTCGIGCGCRACPHTLARCGEDLACEWILGCAQQAGCSDFDVCYEETECIFIIDRSGGPESLGASLAREAMACLAEVRCPIGC